MICKYNYPKSNSNYSTILNEKKQRKLINLLCKLNNKDSNEQYK